MKYIIESCKFTASVAAQRDARQKPITNVLRDSEETKLLLRGSLLLEETVETLRAMALNIKQELDLVNDHDPDQARIDLRMTVCSHPHWAADLEKTIDGACDMIYVATGLLVSLGVDVEAHMREVCAANNRKFPGGKAITDNSTGKYLKPQGWKGPDHKKILARSKKKAKKK